MRIAKTDANQKAIIGALRNIGASVESMHKMGSGFPDLAVGYQGRNLFLEVKDGDKPPSARKLTPDQEKWHAAWRGAVHVVESVEQALAIVMGKS